MEKEALEEDALFSKKWEYVEMYDKEWREITAVVDKKEMEE